jgi:hypothetical protein
MTSTEREGGLEKLIEPTIDDVLLPAVRTVVAVSGQLPTFDDVQAMLDVAQKASERGHFLPDEDDQLRATFSSYLGTRAALMTTLEELKPLVLNELKTGDTQRLDLFLVSFCIASMLMRSGKFLVDTARKDKVLWRKLDEPEPRLGIPRKQFTRIYESMRSVQNYMTFSTGVNFWNDNRDRFATLADDPTFGPVYELQLAEEPYIDTNLNEFAKNRIQYRAHSIRRRRKSALKKVSFAMFEASGRVIAELRNQWRRKRVTPGVQRKVKKLLQPGDVIITRHDDAASNLFLPGFWPHGALYIGTHDERVALGVDMDEDRSARSRESDVLEARKDGVLFRQLADTLTVDAFVVIRPKLTAEEISNGLSQAITHEGKKYDFEFDFRRSDRLVCTEIIYRAFHGVGEIQFELSKRAGRVCLSAEDLLDRAVDGTGFEVVAVYGESGNRFSTGGTARQRLMESYRD